MAVNFLTQVQRDSIVELYIAYFNRAPEAAGLNYWSQTMLASLNAGQTEAASLSGIANQFYAAGVQYNVYSASQTVESFITTAYANALGRDSVDPAGMAYWKAKLNSSEVSRGEFVQTLIKDAKAFAGDATWGWVSTYMANRVTVGNAFADSSTSLTGEAAIVAGKTALSGVTVELAKSGQTPAEAMVVFNANAPGAVAATNTTLTVGQDNKVGTAGNDLFTANIFDNSNTLQSGDKITGGAGADRLNADIGNSQKFAITPETTGVEQVAIRAQAVTSDSSNNNLQYAVQIDAQRMVGVTHWESNNSRADLLIEDVRILPTQITKDITIAMVETDPGHVDMGVYFDQYSLRSAPAVSSGAVLRLQLMDTRSSDAGTAKLLNNPYNGFTFKLDAATITVSSAAIDTAQTYAELQVAVAAAVKAVPALAAFTVTLGANFTAIDTISGKVQSGQEIVLTNTGAGVVSTDATTGWTAAGVVPSSSGLHTFVTSAPASTAVFKVTSTVILDDVGRGSTAGDLVIGGLSVGTTSSSKGVERFEIEVRDNSKLESIKSTNNTLQEVTIKNGLTTSSSFAYVKTAANSGDLTVNGNSGTNGGNIANGGATDAQLGINAPLPGTVDSGNYGFSDVRLIDASAMTGNLSFTAEITKASIAKYTNLVDTQAAPAPDMLNAHGAIADFAYTGGAGNDTMLVAIDAATAASRSTLVSGREDFTFAIAGGAGDDKITVAMNNTANYTSTLNWYNNQDLNNNFTVSGGAGNDTIRTPGAGDMKIDGGAGKDAIYTDNTGGVAAFVLNTVNQTATGFFARDLENLRSDTNETYGLYNSKLSVTFKGVVTAAQTVAGSNYSTSDLEINQAIKAAINNDAVLSKLVLATDGPANSLVVTSLIDGSMSTADLTVSLAWTAPAVGSLTALDIASAGKAYGQAAPTEATVIAAMTAAFAAYNTNADYATAMANNGAVDLTGAASTTTSDNIVTGGADNDVIVLGTTTGLNYADSSNETLVFGKGFGADTVINFAATGSGIDHLDFALLGGTAVGAVTTDKSVVVGATLGTVDLVAALFAAANTAAQTHVYVSVSGTVGTVYSVVDAIGASNAVATNEGTINLAGTGWAGMTGLNIVNSSIVDYSLLEGATAKGTFAGTGIPGSAATVLPVGTTTSGATTVAATAAADVFSLNVGAARLSGPNTQDAITAFAVGADSLSFSGTGATPGAYTLATLPAAAGTSFVNTITSETLINFGADANGDLITLSLVGVAGATSLVNVVVVS